MARFLLFLVETMTWEEQSEFQTWIYLVNHMKVAFDQNGTVTSGIMLGIWKGNNKFYFKFYSAFYITEYFYVTREA